MYASDEFYGDDITAGDCGPVCVQCGASFNHGCNSSFCSQACEDEFEMYHERAHAGISDPDECDRGDSCPLGGRDAE